MARSLLGGAFKALGAGAKTFGALKVNQEAEQAKFLREENMARFKSNLLEERAISGEERAFQRTGSGVFDESGRELTRKESEDFGGETFTKSQTKKRGLLADAETAREITQGDRVATIKSAFPEMTSTQAKKADSLIQKRKLVGGKALTGEVKASVYDKSRTAVLETIDPDDPTLDKKVQAEYNKRISAITPAQLDLEGAVSPETLGQPTAIVAPPEAVNELLKGGGTKEAVSTRADQERLNVRNISGLSKADQGRAIALIDTAEQAALKTLTEQERRPTLLGEGATDFPIGPATGTSVLR